MEITPILNDSGLGSDGSASGVKRILQFTTYECTPRPFARKRKSFARYYSDDALGRKLSDVLETSQEAPIHNGSYEASFMGSSFMRSSPINTELSTSLEKCTLNNEQTCKKFKWDDEVFDCSRKSNSEPGTPQRAIELTPTKPVQQKMGTPERNEILYPHLKEVKPLPKPKTAQRLRDDLKRAPQHRKRLFICRDFVYLFSKVRDHRAIIHNIFSYLDESDLARVGKVSPLWRRVLRSDYTSFQRLQRHARSLSATKENRKNVKSNGTPVRTWSPPGSPQSQNWRQCVKLGMQINPSQSLIKCLSCLRPAVLEQNIAQCSWSQCGYIWCTKCLSGSKLGPSDLYCQCTDLKIVVSPAKERCGLSDISNADSSSNSFSFVNNSSSGYFSQTDFEKSNSYYQPVVQVAVSKTKQQHMVLTDSNKNRVLMKTPVLATPHKGETFHAVYRQWRDRKLSRTQESVEPGSPPKLNIPAAGSKKSKKNLRRLCF